MNIDFQDILKELEFRVPTGIIDLNEESQVTTLVEILRENGVEDPNEIAQKARVYFSYVNEAKKKAAPTKQVGTKFKAFSKDGEKAVYFKTKAAMDAKIKAGTHISVDQKQKNDTEKAKEKSKGQTKKPEPKSGTIKVSGAEKRAAAKGKKGQYTKDSIYTDSNRKERMLKAREGLISGDVSGLETLNNDLYNHRKRGFGGAGGSVPSYGESLCTKVSTDMLKVGGSKNYLDNNEKKTSKKLTELLNKAKKDKKFKNNFWKSVDDAMLYTGETDRNKAMKLVAAAEVFFEETKSELMKDRKSVWHLSGTKGFGRTDERLKSWTDTAFYGGIAMSDAVQTGDTSLDSTKPMSLIQSDPNTSFDGHDKTIIESLGSLLNDAKKRGSKEDEEHYAFELESARAIKFADTKLVGYDKKGRLSVYYITNKKDSDLLDIWGNTTPENALKILKEKFGFTDKVANKIKNVLDAGIQMVSQSKTNTNKVFSTAAIDNSFIKAVDNNKELKAYKQAIENDKDFQFYAKENGLKTTGKDFWNTVQTYIKDKGPAEVSYEKYGKLYSKVGELARDGKLGETLSDSIIKAQKHKTTEQEMVAKVHDDVVKVINKEDQQLGYPKEDGINGPNTQAYLTTIMHSMHFDIMVTNFDQKLGALTGARHSTTEDFRGCLEKLSGYKRDPKHNETEHREALNKHLIQKSKIRASDRAIEVTDGNEKYVIAYDTWRTAGTTQKVEKKLGDHLRKCIMDKTDSRRKERNNK